MVKHAGGPVGADPDGSLKYRVLSHAYVWLPVMAPEIFSCLQT